MQSKIFVIFLAVVLLIAMVHFMPQPMQNQVDLDGATCQIFCRQTTLSHADVGFGKIVCCDGSRLKQSLANCKDVDGVSVTITAKTQHVSAILRKFGVKIHTKQTLDGLTILCGYSPKIVGYIYVDGNKTNVQIAYDGLRVTIGSPLILGDY